MVEIRLVKHSHEKEQLLDLFRLSYGRTMPAELWDWKYIQNPLAPPDPELFVVLDKGRIVGARSFRLVQMWLGNHKVKAIMGGNVMVHPDYQRQGIFSQMVQCGFNYLRENDYALTGGFDNPKSLPGSLKHGYRIVVPMETMFRPIHSQKLLSYELGNKVLGSGLGFFYDKLLNRKTRDTFQPSTSFKVEIFDQFNDELREIDALRDKSLIELVRSESYLRWLFDQRPGRDYRYIVAKRGERLWGYAVVSAEKQINGLVYGYIVDHLVRDRDISCFQALITRSLDELEKSECDIAFVLAIGEAMLREQLLKNLGFKSSLIFPYSRFFPRQEYFVAIRIDEQAAPEVDIYDKENWRLTYAYSGNI